MLFYLVRIKPVDAAGSAHHQHLSSPERAGCSIAELIALQAIVREVLVDSSFFCIYLV